jgi:CNT family concentrative nucleoside transporter
VSIESVGRGLIGIVFLIGLAFLLSAKRKHVSWTLVLKTLAAQIGLAVLILHWPAATKVLDYLSGLFVKVIGFSAEGTSFLLGSFQEGTVHYGLMNFLTKVLPSIIFFSALTGLLYYVGILQRVVNLLAWMLRKSLGISGPESLAVAGNIFLGQTEAPLLVRPFLKIMTKSELNTLMTGGMATIAGGVLAAYVGFLGGESTEQQIFFAKHLLGASLMSAPASILFAKLLYPEKGAAHNFEKEKIKLPYGNSFLESITIGTSEGLKLAVNVAAMLLVFISLVAFGNFLLSNTIGSMFGINEWIAANTAYEVFNFQFILGCVMAPVSWLVGVPSDDIFLVGQLIGEKTVLNEFVAYISLGEFIDKGSLMHEKSVIMSTYILCGFSNFSSIGIQMGGIGALVEGRRNDLASLAFRALLGASLACLLTGTVIGIFC